MKTIQNILICTDFSEASKNSLIYGVNLAEKIQGRIFILHVETEEGTTDTDAAFLQLEHDFLYLNRQPCSFIKRSGDPLTIIHNVIIDEKIDLTIVGMKHINLHEESSTSSLTAMLIENPKSALLRIPGNCTRLNIRNIGFASDNSEPEEDNIYMLRFLAERLNAEINVIHVQQPKSASVAGRFEQIVTERLGRNFRDFVKMESENLIQAMNTFTEENKIDLLTVVHHCSRLEREPLHRSVSKQLAFRAKVPLLILPEAVSDHAAGEIHA